MACQLYIAIEASASAAERLSAVLAAVPVASVLIRPPQGLPLTAALAKPLVDLAQAVGVAALIENDAALARVLRADGVHLTTSLNVAERYAEARETVGRGAIVGAEPAGTRHSAMELAEAGAEYVAFAGPGEVDTQEEYLSWWAEIFEIPCVAVADAAGESVTALAGTGADFVLVSLPPAQTVEASVRFAADMRAAVSSADGRVSA